MADLMKHNLSYKKETLKEYYFEPPEYSEELCLWIWIYTLEEVMGLFPRKKKKKAKKTLRVLRNRLKELKYHERYGIK